jgi:hypothetical protein
MLNDLLTGATAGLARLNRGYCRRRGRYGRCRPHSAAPSFMRSVSLSLSAPASHASAKRLSMVTPTAPHASPLILAGRFVGKLAFDMVRGEISSMKQRIELPIYTIIAPEGFSLFPMKHDGRRWIPIFTNQENADLFLSRTIWPGRVVAIAKKSDVCLLLGVLSENGTLTSDYGFVLDPLSINDIEYQVAPRPNFMVMALDF